MCCFGVIRTLGRFFGTIPSAWSTLSYLNLVFLGTNQLTGTIPAFFGALPRLSWLQLSANRLVGSLPSGFGVYWPGMGVLQLNGNNLTGTLDNFLTVRLTPMKYLSTIDIHDNGFRCVCLVNVVLVNVVDMYILCLRAGYVHANFACVRRAYFRARVSACAFVRLCVG